jgi:hypothetical protein
MTAAATGLAALKPRRLALAYASDFDGFIQSQMEDAHIPGLEVTPYWVQRSDGTRFWATREELTAQ